jgi:hypothetical protein
MTINTTKLKASGLVATLVLAGSLGLTACNSGTKTEETKTETKTEAPAGGTKTETPAAGGTPATTVAAGTAVALSAAEKLKLTPIKTALVMANTAIKGGDVEKAKSQFTKFDGLWKMAEPMVKEKAGSNFALIEQGIAMVKTHLVDAKTPDKAKAGEGLTSAIKAIDAVMNKK